MKMKPKSVFAPAIVFVFLSFALNVQVEAQDAHFHNAPSSSAQQTNPYSGQRSAIVEGARLYTMNCGACHGIGGTERFIVFVLDGRRIDFIMLIMKKIDALCGKME
jgi:hypothetical protein